MKGKLNHNDQRDDGWIIFIGRLTGQVGSKINGTAQQYPLLRPYEQGIIIVIIIIIFFFFSFSFMSMMKAKQSSS